MSLLEHSSHIRVRYSETDAMGFLHHANYLSYFEIARTELFRAQGGNYRRMEELGLFFVVAEAQCKYRKSARYDDELTVTASIVRSGPIKLIHRYQIRRGDELIAEGETTLACVDREGAIQPIPENLVALTGEADG